MSTRAQRLNEIKKNSALGTLKILEEIESDSKEAVKNELAQIKSEGVEAVRQAVAEAKESSVFSDLEPAKELARRTAQEVITDFKATIDGKVDSVISEMKETNKTLVSEKKSAMSDLRASFKAETAILNKNASDGLSQALTTQKSDGDALSKTMLAEIDKITVGAEKSIEKIIAQVSDMKGPQGEPGASGKPGKDGKAPLMEKILSSLLKMKEFTRLVTEIAQTVARREGARGGGGGGLSTPTTFSFTGDASTTAFTLDTNVAANGLACWAYVNGQWIQPGVHFNISGKVLTMTSTLELGDALEGFYLRA